MKKENIILQIFILIHLIINKTGYTFSFSYTVLVYNAISCQILQYTFTKF